jgi:hypothetical protein
MSEALSQPDQPSAGHTPQLPDQLTRWLLAYLPDAEALQVVTGGRYGLGPYPAELQQHISAARNAVAARSAFINQPAVVHGAEDDALLGPVAERPDIQAAFAGAVNWHPSFVDLRTVISLQKLVVIDGMDERVNAAVGNRAALVELCLPQPAPEPIEVGPDPAGRTVTVTSLNPNLHFGGFNLDQLAHGGPIICGCGISANVVTVVKFAERYFLRDGTHRAVGLLRHGVFEAPAILVEATTTADITTNRDFFHPDLVLGERPPLLTDFLDDNICANATRRRPRRVVRLIADEYDVPS